LRVAKQNDDTKNCAEPPECCSAFGWQVEVMTIEGDEDAPYTQRGAAVADDVMAMLPAISRRRCTCAVDVADIVAAPAAILSENFCDAAAIVTLALALAAVGLTRCAIADDVAAMLALAAVLRTMPTGVPVEMTDAVAVASMPRMAEVVPVAVPVIVAEPDVSLTRRGAEAEITAAVDVAAVGLTRCATAEDVAAMLAASSAAVVTIPAIALAVTPNSAKASGAV